jgi:hypothetical protein
MIERVKILALQLLKRSDRHRWASTSISMSAIYDIDFCYSDIGDKYVELKNIIPISTSEFIPISDIEENKNFMFQVRSHTPWNGERAL